MESEFITNIDIFFKVEHVSYYNSIYDHDYIPQYASIDDNTDRLWYPVGALDRYHTNIISTNYFWVIFYPPDISGTYNIIAYVTQTNLQLVSTAEVKVKELYHWGAKYMFITNGNKVIKKYELVGETQIHKSNHFSTFDTYLYLDECAEIIAEKYVNEGYFLRINDMSLPYGGVFDICDTSVASKWQYETERYDSYGVKHKIVYREGIDTHYYAPSHWEHRKGKNADVYLNVPVICGSMLDNEIQTILKDGKFGVLVHSNAQPGYTYIDHYHITKK